MEANHRREDMLVWSWKKNVEFWEHVVVQNSWKWDIPCFCHWFLHWEGKSDSITCWHRIFDNLEQVWLSYIHGFWTAFSWQKGRSTTCMQTSCHPMPVSWLIIIAVIIAFCECYQLLLYVSHCKWIFVTFVQVWNYCLQYDASSQWKITT